MIERFYTTSFTTKRLSYNVNDVGTYSSHTTFDGHIQQARPELNEILKNQLVNVFIIWCDEATDVQVGDLVDDGTREYVVKEIQRNTVGDNQHLELIVSIDQV